MKPIVIKKLCGHSGCNLKLYQENNKIFLRKDAGSVSYNMRLRKQCAKQKHFKLVDVKVPTVFKYGYDEEGLFYFDMEYINGIILSEYMKTIKIKEIVDLVGLLFKSLPVKSSKINYNAANVFKAKIQSLTNSLDLKNDHIVRALKKVNHYDFSNVPLSPCCGDLTLENIIISSSGIYVIDLLDSFYNSWMIDVAKLLQDIDLGWSYRYQDSNLNLNLRLATTKQALFDYLLGMPNGKNNLKTIYYILLINVLRIYPYTHDDTTISFLDSSVEKILNTINDMEKI